MYQLQFIKIKTTLIWITLWLICHSCHIAFGLETNPIQPTQNIERTIVQFETSAGNFFIRLFTEDTPLTCQNFLDYVENNYYDNTIIHRVIPRFIIQGGGFDKDLIPKPFMNPIQNEARKSKENLRGTIGMALSVKKEHIGSQFYINLIDNPDLNYDIKTQIGYPVFGEIIEGMTVIEKISRKKTKQINFFSEYYNRYMPMHHVPEELILIKSVKKIDVATLQKHQDTNHSIIDF